MSTQLARHGVHNEINGDGVLPNIYERRICSCRRVIYVYRSASREELASLLALVQCSRRVRAKDIEFPSLILADVEKLN